MICTFYSFKGGVGRSMALANIAELLYKKGLSVLMVDFDLEAPGLDDYFKSNDDHEYHSDLSSKRGLIDLLSAYKKSVAYMDLYPEAKGKMESEKLDDMRFNRRDVPLESFKNFITTIYKEDTSAGSLYLMTAGKRNDSNLTAYANAVRSFDWEEFYKKFYGEEFFEWFRDEAESIADIVLIDSRTGITEIGGVSTYHLADMVIFFIAPNQQNINGISLMAKSLTNPDLIEKGRNGRPISLIFVPSRVERSEAKRLDKFEKLFEKFNKYVSRKIVFDYSPFIDLQIPYVPYYSYMENLAAREPKSASSHELIQSYERIIDIISQHAPKDSIFYKLMLISSNPKLSSIASQPIMSKLLLTAIDETTIDMLSNKSQIYLYATKKIILENLPTNQVLKSLSEKLYFYCEIAWEIILLGRTKIRFDEFPQQIRDFLSKDSNANFEESIISSLINKYIFLRDLTGNYHFATNDLLGYFVALKLAYEINCLDPEYLRVYSESDRKSLEISYWKKNADINELLSGTFGMKSFKNVDMQIVRENLLELLSINALTYLRNAITPLDRSRSEETNYFISNIEIILQDIGAVRPFRYIDTVQLIKMPETLIPPKPAGIDKMVAALRQSGIFVNWDSSLQEKKEINIPGYHEAIESFIMVQKDQTLDEALDIARSALSLNSGLRDYCLAVHAFAGLQALYLRKFNDAKRYFDLYFNIGGNESWYHLKLGLVNLYSGDIDVARDQATLVTSSDDFRMKGRAYLLLGILDRNDNNHNEAIAKYKDALEIFYNIGDRYHAGMTLANLGITYRLKNEIENSLACYKEALSIFGDKGEYKYRKACVLARLGTLYRIMQNYDNSLLNYQESIAIFRDFEDEIRVGLVFKEIGITYLLVGRMEDAIDNNNMALQIFEKYENSYITKDLRDHEGIYSRKGQVTYNLGLAYFMQGKWNEAERYFRSSLRIFHEVKDSIHTCMSLISLGSALRMKDEYKAAYIVLNEALDIIRETSDISREGQILTKLGGVCRQLHLYKEAIKNYERSLKIAKELDDAQWEGKILLELGTVYKKLNNFDQAIKYYDRSIEIFSQNNDKAKTNLVKSQKAEISLMIGDFDNALYLIDQSIKEIDADSVSSKEDGFLLEDIQIIDGIKDTGIDIKEFNSAIKKISELGGKSLEGKINRVLGLIYLRMGQFENAIDYLNQSLDIFNQIDDRSQQGKAYCHIGQALSGAKSFKKSIESINYSISIFDDLNDSIRKSWAVEQLGNVYLKMRRWDDATDVYKRALLIGSTSKYIHLALAICYLNLGKDEEFNEECTNASHLMKGESQTIYDSLRLKAVCGDKNDALDFLEVALEKSQVNIDIIKRDTFLIFIQNEPRFLKLVNRYANIDYFDMISFM